LIDLSNVERRVHRLDLAELREAADLNAQGKDGLGFPLAGRDRFEKFAMHCPDGAYVGLLDAGLR
jgi:hypothetical protein